jgi:hypothetical protein
MSPIESVIWRGFSGKNYVYSSYELPVEFKPGRNGNYIFAKNVNNFWVPIYIGEGDLGEKITPQHQKWFCISKKGMTHVHIHLNEWEHARQHEAQDLLDAHPEALEPYGCNEKTKG